MVGVVKISLTAATLLVTPVAVSLAANSFDFVLRSSAKRAVFVDRGCFAPFLVDASYVKRGSLHICARK